MWGDAIRWAFGVWVLAFAGSLAFILGYSLIAGYLLRRSIARTYQEIRALPEVIRD